MTYERGAHAVTEGCCCGNELAVGPDARRHITARDGFEVRTASVTAPWREQLPVVWAIGPSTHPEVEAQGHDSADAAPDPGTAIDPVCGMTVEIAAAAMAKDLDTTHLGVGHFFCGRGCRLDFMNEPERYLAHDYVPSM